MRKGHVADVADVADGLIDLVLTGEFPAGRALPSEAELAVRFEVSRQTSAVPQIRRHAIAWHAKILETLHSSDPDGAREAVREHLLQTERDMERFLGSIGLDGVVPPA